ncbi:MAG: tRNA (guanosine(18)-2'-O)-methyltransferase [Chitinophagales bacterium]|nr:MAG: tRNA (guanosine(18)-2'-O)-methyltransferase [Chitinophagales bacterium]
MTPEREQRMADVLKRRQPDITVVLENVHDPHNIAAVLRTCDAVGVQTVYAVNEKVPRPKKFGHKTSSGSEKWVDVYYYRDPDTCLEDVRKKYEKVYALSSDHPGKSLFEADLTGSVALLFGNEHAGLSSRMLSHADELFTIPMVGMVTSLNISVACAVTLYEAFRQRYAAGLYERTSLTEEQAETYKKWVLREIRKRYHLSIQKT